MRGPSRNSATGGTARASSPTAHTITPHLVVGGAAQAADWYQQAFGAQPGARIPPEEVTRAAAAMFGGEAG